MTYRRNRPSSKDEACTRAGEGTGVSQVRVKERRKGDVGCFLASALRCTQWECRHWILAVPLGLGRRVGPPTCRPATPSSCNPGRGALCFCISAETSHPCTAV